MTLSISLEEGPGNSFHTETDFTMGLDNALPGLKDEYCVRDVLSYHNVPRVQDQPVHVRILGKTFMLAGQKFESWLIHEASSKTQIKMHSKRCRSLMPCGSFSRKMYISHIFHVQYLMNGIKSM